MTPATFLLLSVLYWLFLCASAYLVTSQKVRNILAWAIPIAAIAFATLQFGILEPWQRLFLGTISLLFTIKAAILMRRSTSDLYSFSKIGLFIYMTLWPGMDAQPFARTTTCNEDGKRFVRGYICLWLGLLTLIIASTFTIAPDSYLNWLGILALLLTVHFGYAEILTCAMRIVGFDVQPLFNAPLKSISLKDFWSKRWNLAFVEMDKILFLPFAKKRFSPPLAILFVFAISGLLHEAAISYPTGQLWGLPLLYFFIQGIAMLIEKKLFSRQTSPLITRIFAWLFLLLPLPLLFTTPFQSAFITPLRATVAHMVHLIDPTSLLHLALWLAAIGYVFILMAGLQVPFRLNWKTELTKLTDLNKKISVFSAGTVGILIVSFGALTFALHNQLANGERTAVLISIVMAAFWVARLLVDFFYFHHTDWPKGVEFVIGHTLLTTLFICLSGVYVYTVAAHLPAIQYIFNPIPTTPEAVPLSLFDSILWVAAFGNFCSLATELMIAARSGLRKDLNNLGTFNRKVMINYVAYVYTIIFAFGCLTLALHDQFLSGEWSATCIALVMAIFWLIRLIFDCLWLRPSDFADAAEASTSRIVSAIFAALLSAVYFYVVAVNWIMW